MKEKAVLELQISDLKKQNADVERKNQMLKRSLENENVAKDKMKYEYESLNSYLTELQNKNDELCTEIKELQNAIESEIVSRFEMKKMMEQRNQELQDHIQKLENDIRNSKLKGFQFGEHNGQEPNGYANPVLLSSTACDDVTSFYKAEYENKLREVCFCLAS